MKQCPECRKTYPDADAFCARDGSTLHALPKNAGTLRKRIFVLAAVVVVLGFVIVIGFPYILKRAGSNFEVSMLGISCEKDSISDVLAQQTREILEDFINVIVGGENRSGKMSVRDFTLQLELKNGNFFQVKIDSVEFSLFVNGRNVGKGALLGNESVSVRAFERKKISCPLTLYPMPVLKSAGKIVASGSLRYGIRGQVVGVFLLWKIKHPFDERGFTIQPESLTGGDP
jgi:hypothetical protein